MSLDPTEQAILERIDGVQAKVRSAEASLHAAVDSLDSIRPDLAMHFEASGKAQVVSRLRDFLAEFDPAEARSPGPDGEDGGGEPDPGPSAVDPGTRPETELQTGAAYDPAMLSPQTPEEAQAYMMHAARQGVTDFYVAHGEPAKGWGPGTPIFDSHGVEMGYVDGDGIYECYRATGKYHEKAKDHVEQVTTEEMAKASPDFSRVHEAQLHADEIRMGHR